MGVINLDYKMSAVKGRFKHLSLSRAEFSRFNAEVLELGNISQESDHIDALAAIFDLEGFTAFCNQIDPQLVVPEYLDRFLNWLFAEISNLFAQETREADVVLWGKFPFFAKYLGDGILFLWDTHGLAQASLGNIVINLFKVCMAYRETFLPEIEKDLAQVPHKLRCGIARGQVVPIGGGRDFVGPCMNMAARLQKISQLSFAFPRKGFKPEDCFSDTWCSRFIPKNIAVRGIGQDEHILVYKEEFDALSDEEKGLFRDP